MSASTYAQLMSTLRGAFWFGENLKQKIKPNGFSLDGAGEETLTLDLFLGKEAL